jgi:hypothetical protein
MTSAEEQAGRGFTVGLGPMWDKIMRRHTRHLSAAIVACATIWRLTSVALADPSLGSPVFGIAPGAAQLSLINCEDTNFLYVVQTSTNLMDWTSVTTNFATGSNSPVAVPAPKGLCYYRLATIPHVAVPLFGYAIVTRSNFDMKGSFPFVDSFDSSNPLYNTAGQYDVNKRKAGGDIATVSSVIGDVSIGNGNIYGRVLTGPGTVQNAVQIGANGAVGDVNWNASNSYIEPGHWAGDFYVSFPDVPTPNYAGAALPDPTNGIITLDGGNYTTGSNQSLSFFVTAPTTLWVQGSFYPANLAIATTNNASLVVYVGTTNTNGGDILQLQGFGMINQPGYAVNLQFYCLPSLTSIVILGRGFNGTIYAPEANVTGSGGGTNLVLFSGAMVVNSVTFNGYTGLHYDENLKVAGPTR